MANGPVLEATINRLRELVGTDTLLDVGKGAARPLGVSVTTLHKATKYLAENEGFNILYLGHTQLTDRLDRKKVVVKVLAPPNIGFVEAMERRGTIKQVKERDPN